MLSTRQLLEALDEREIKGVQIAECLGVSTAGVSRLLSGERQLKLDEAKKLVERFNLAETAPPPSPLTIPVARLLILHAASYLDAAVDPDDPRVEELAQDFRAFSRFALDPRVRENTDAASGFLQGTRLARDPRA